MNPPLPAYSTIKILFLVSLFTLSQFITISQGSPARARNEQKCFRNCHLCTQMYGSGKFYGHLCAHTCIKLRGKLIPDCTDLVSIAPYLDPTVLLDNNSIDN